MANTIQHGISHVVIAEITNVGNATTAPTVGDVIAWPGAVKIGFSASSSESKFSADNNTAYWSGRSKGSSSGNLETAYMPETVRTALYGYSVGNDGVTIENDAPSTKMFAVGYQVEVEGDADGERVWNSCINFGFPDEEHNTDGDSIEPDTVSVPFTRLSIPLLDENGHRTVCARCASTGSAYGTFLNAPVFKHA